MDGYNHLKYQTASLVTSNDRPLAPAQYGRLVVDTEDLLGPGLLQASPSRRWAIPGYPLADSRKFYDIRGECAVPLDSSETVRHGQSGLRWIPLLLPNGGAAQAL